MSWITVSILFITFAEVSWRVLAASTPEVQYFTQTGIRLVGVVVCVLLVVAFITWITTVGFEYLGRPLRSRAYVLFVGWKLLRSHRERLYQPQPYEGGSPPPIRWLLVTGVLLAAGSYFFDAVPWPRLTPNVATALQPLQFCLAILAVVFLTWAFRKKPASGALDRLDRLELHVRNLPNLLTVTTTTFISIVGVGVGIWALIVVLSVMSGFETDLRNKILSTNPHVVVQDDEPMAGIPNARERLEALRKISGVSGAIPYVQGDVIVTSRENRNISLQLRGIEPDDIATAEHHLERSLTSGELGNLLYPERVVPSARWRLRQIPSTEPMQAPAKADSNIPAAQRAIEPRPIPGIEPRPIPGIEPSPIPGVDSDPTFALEEGLRPGILLGRELATSLRVGMGSEVTVISPNEGAGFLGIQPRARTFRVAGIFHTGMYEFDLKLAYVRLSEAQRFFHMNDDINRIELRLDDPDDTERVVAAATQIIAGTSSLEAISWKRMNKNLFSALQLEKFVMFIVLGFIILVASFNVVGSLVMIIIEKSPEIAIMKSLGAPRHELRRLFLVLGGFIGGIGAVAGLIVGLLTCGFIHYVGIQLPRQYYITMLPVHIDPATILTVFLAGIGLCLIATLYPAHAAARIHPVEGLRYD